MLLFIEQVLNGLQLGFMLFLLSAGLTLVFGIMQVINLAHGSFYMIGAYVGTTVIAHTGSFTLGILAALSAAALAGRFRRLRRALLLGTATFWEGVDFPGELKKIGAVLTVLV